MNDLALTVSNIFDYSGMFPPESKALEDALKDSATFPTALKFPEMLNSDFVLSLENLKQITPSILVKAGFGIGRKVRICTLGSEMNAGSKSAEELSEIQRFNKESSKWSTPAEVVSYEVKISSSLRLNDAKDAISNSSVLLCLEPNLSLSNWTETLASACELVSELGQNVSLKIRGTGPTGIENEKICRVIEACVSKNIHLKATGGMHHPILETSRYNNHLGFLNIASALLLKRALKDRFSAQDILKCLRTDDAKAFSFKDGLRWGEFHITHTDLARLKSEWRFSIGSCNIFEPDSDLVRLFGT